MKTRLVYFTKASRTTDRTLALNALAGQSALEAKLWTTFLSDWDAATTSQKLNYSVPEGLPGGDHVFVVLGGSLNSDGTLKAQTINRLTVAKAALEAYPHSGVVVTGGWLPKDGGHGRVWDHHLLGSCLSELGGPADRKRHRLECDVLVGREG